MEQYENDGDDDIKHIPIQKRVIPTEADFLYLGSEVPGINVFILFCSGSCRILVCAFGVMLLRSFIMNSL